MKNLFNKYEIKKEEFPDKLLKIKNSPEKLYAIGNKDLLFEEAFSVVGTRKISEYGKKNCEYFAKEIVLRNIPIVSGMALGTDTIAHQTALKNYGKTIAVLGSGFNYIFPKENENLFYKIIENGGLVLTEYDDNVEPLKSNFPLRNRIITAISEGILVVEAAYRSGTSITARNAKEQGKLVFALPGMLNSSVGVGVNKLIQKGAILTTNIDDILQYYPNFKSRKKRILKSKKNYLDNINIHIEDEKLRKKYLVILKILNKNPKSIEELVEECGINILEDISYLELNGIIMQRLDGKYVLVKI